MYIGQRKLPWIRRGPFDQILENFREELPSGHTSKSDRINLVKLIGRYWALDGEQWRTCLEDNIADLPKASAQNLEKLDRGSGFVKILALIQVGYLIIQLVIREISGLSSSQLEVTALAFASSSFLTYILLWGRPQGVESVQIVEAKRIPAWRKIEEIMHRGPQYLWAKYRTGSRPDAVLEFVPIPNDASHIGGGIPSLLSRHVGTNDELMALSLGSILGGVLFGGVHCLAWNFSFPTQGETIAWRVCSIVISVLPLISIIPLGIWMEAHPSFWAMGIVDKPWNTKSFRFLLGSVLVGGCLIPYILARLFLIVEIFRTLFFLPPDAFMDTWSGSFPHWG